MDTVEANETRYSNPDQQRQKKGSGDPPKQAKSRQKLWSETDLSKRRKQDNRTVLFRVRMGSTTATKIEVVGCFPSRQRPGDKVVSYTNSETRDLNAEAILPL